MPSRFRVLLTTSSPLDAAAVTNSSASLSRLVDFLNYLLPHQQTSSGNAAAHQAATNAAAHVPQIYGRNKSFQHSTKKQQRCLTSRNLSLTSLMMTCCPTSRPAVAMPLPIKPPPMTATLFTLRGFRPASVTPDTFLVERCAKKMCTRAL